MDDQWPGEQAYRRVIAYEAELIRAGWRIFRIRQSELAIDPEGTERSLVEFLSARGVHPVEEPAVEAAPVVDEAAPAEEPAGATAPERRPRSKGDVFLEVIGRTGLLPPMGRDVLALLEPVPGEQTTWSTSDDLGLTTENPSHGTVLAWSRDDLTVRTVMDGWDLSVSGRATDLRWLSLMAEVNALAQQHEDQRGAVTGQIDLDRGGAMLVDGRQVRLGPADLTAERLRELANEGED